MSLLPDGGALVAPITTKIGTKVVIFIKEFMQAGALTPLICRM